MEKQADNVINTPSLLQPWLEEFDQLRGFYDEEVHSSVTRLCTDPAFVSLLTDFFLMIRPVGSGKRSNLMIKNIINELQQVKSIDTLQVLEHTIASPLVEMSVSRLDCTGLKALSADRHYLFISNHRDILMDPLLLNLLLYKNQYKTAHCAIGDNLLQNPIALQFARLNKCFRVLRSLKSPKAMLKAMKLQSAYIRYLSFNETNNLWIAQKEGRSKDNLDKTNPALIKMLGLAKPKEMSFGEYIRRLNIVPVSFSYEWDPCDIDKATELEITEHQGHYQKDAIEDFTSAKKGLLQPKGAVHVHFDDTFLIKDMALMNHLDIAESIDQSIAQNSRVFPVNVAAAGILGDLFPKDEVGLSGSQPYTFSEQQVIDAKKMLNQRLEHCTDGIRRRVLSGYATAVRR